MKITIDEIEQAARALAAAAAAYDPAIGATVAAVVAAASAAKDLGQRVLAQAQEDPAVWSQISADYQDAINAFDASVAAHPGA